MPETKEIKPKAMPAVVGLVPQNSSAKSIPQNPKPANIKSRAAYPRARNKYLRGKITHL